MHVDASFSGVFNGDILADKDPAQPSDPSSPAQTTLGSQLATGRQPQRHPGQVERALVLPFSQVRPGLDSPQPGYCHVPTRPLWSFWLINIVFVDHAKLQNKQALFRVLSG